MNHPVSHSYSTKGNFSICVITFFYVIKKHDGTIVADKTSILSRWEQFFGNLLNVNQSEGSEVYTADPDIPEPSFI